MSKAEKTRQFIIEKTAPLFNTKGYAGTSLNDMTEATGLTKGSIYGNFSNKDEVALAAFDHNIRCIDAIIRQEMEKKQSFREKLKVYMEVYSNYLKYPFPAGGCPILNTATESDDTHPQLRNRAAEAIHAWKSRIVKLIEKGIEHREFRRSVNAEQAALTLIAMLEGALMIARLTGKLNYRKAIMESIEKFVDELG